MPFKFTVLTLLLITYTDLLAQPNFELAWSNGEDSQINPYDADCIGYINLECQKIRLDTQNDIVVSGISNEQGQWDVLVVKYDNNGNLLWKQLLNWFEGGRDIISEIKIDQNDDIYLLVYNILQDNSRSSRLLKLSAEGDVIWEYLFPETYSAFPEQFIVDENGACYVTGTLFGANNQTKMFIFSLTPEGTLAWEDLDGGQNSTFGELLEIRNGKLIGLGFYGLGGFEPFVLGLYAQIHAFDGERLGSQFMYFDPEIRSTAIGDLGGYFVGENGRFSVRKFNENGEEAWDFAIPSNLPDNIRQDITNHIITDSEGNVYATGTHHGENYGNPSMYTNGDLQVVKLSPSGELLYSYRYEYLQGNTIEAGNRLSLGPDNQLLIGGTSLRLDEGGAAFEYLAIVLDAAGHALDTVRYASDSDAVVKSVALDNDLNIYLTGTASGSTLTQKYNFSTPTNSKEVLHPQEISVFPNPCQEQLTISYPNYSQPYNLKLFSEDGKLVFHRTDCSTEEQLVDTKVLPAGMYYYQLIAAEGLFSGKLVKQR